MKYAVVCFLEESSSNSEIVQEVLVIWLKNRNTVCLWPPNNSAHHVQNATEPTEGWFECRVRCDRICDSLLDARKKCIESSSEDELGKGLRKKVHTKHVNDYKRSCPSPPSYNSYLPYIPNSDPSSSQVEMNAAGMQKNVEVEEYTVLEPYTSEQTEYRSSQVQIIAAEMQKNPVGGYRSEQTDIEYNEEIQNNGEYQPANNRSLVDMAYLERKFDKIIGMQAKILSCLEDLKVSNMSQRTQNNELGEIKRLLPFENFEAFKEFDQRLKDDAELCKKMVYYCESIGGLSAKDLHNRNMSKIMTNLLAESCSWKGLRDNHKIGDFRTLECLLAYLERKFDKIIGMQAKILSCLEDLKVSNMSQRTQNNELGEIKRLLPFENFEAFKEFDQRLKDDAELCKKMVYYCESIGGLSAKDLHNRNMSKIMTNLLAESCSWKGLRDNHKIGDFRTLECLLEVSQKLYQTTQKEFEILTKDWLRHAKQRRLRQDKANRY